MADINVKKTLNNYNKADREYLTNEMAFLALIGAQCNIKTEEDFSEWCKDTLARRDIRKEEEEERKIRKAEEEERKAKAKGMTVDEYREYKKNHNKVVRYEREIRNMKKEVEDLLKEIEWRERVVAETRKKIEG